MFPPQLAFVPIQLPDEFVKRSANRPFHLSTLLLGMQCMVRQMQAKGGGIITALEMLLNDGL